MKINSQFSTLNSQLVLLTALLLLASCAPLRPLAPEAPKGYTKYEPTATVQKAKEKAKEKEKQEIALELSKQEPQELRNITGIATWDKVLSPWLGTPYLLGGSTKKGTDCSGFVSSVYMEKEGIPIPRTSSEGFKKGKRIARDDLTIGDLVFFGNRLRVSHVGIYVGKGKFIHASSSKGVTVSPLDDRYWKPRYLGARRYL